MKANISWRPRQVLAAVTAAVGMLMAASVATAPSALAADVSCKNYSSSTSTCINTSTTIAGKSYSTDWYLPNGTASALMLLEHGFSRGCGNLRNSSKAIAEKGIMVFCVNADMTAGNEALGNTLGDVLTARTITPPSGKALPAKYIVGGHSAGGHFASVVGARLAGNGYDNLKGAILFDGVAAGGFTANLQAISAGNSRPVLEVAARPSLSNSYNNGFGALASLGSKFVGIQLVWTKISGGVPSGGSCHIDVEGENTDVIGILGATCTPSTTQTARLRAFTSTWAKDLATGSHNSAYYCTAATTAGNVSTCGSQVTALVGGSTPVSAIIPTS